VSRYLGAWCLAAAACGSSASTPPPKPPEPPPAPRVDAEAAERAKHDELAAAHRKIESEQQDALAETCTDPEPADAHERCLPSCYATEPADPRAGKPLAGASELRHLVCQRADGSFVDADELDRATLGVRAVHGRFPAHHRKGTWQATLETTLTDAQLPKLPRGDVIVVAGAWRALTHPLTEERLRCVTIAHYTRSRRAVDRCGTGGALACEASGNAAARGINVVHYRLAEARQLQAANHATECQQAALEAVAVARGLPRWRQYAKLNVEHWIDPPAYRTRFDGTLDEDALFAAADQLGHDAEAIYAACGGPTGAATTAAQEQSFHTCW